MIQIKLYLAILAVMNFMFVLAMTYGPHWFVYPAIFTALNLMTFDVTSRRPLRKVGSIFNFIGVIAGGIPDVTPIMYMALYGSLLLFTDHVSQHLSKKKLKSTKTD